MKRFFYTLVLTVLYFSSIHAQDYFQQKVDYIIDVTLDDKAHLLTGNETFVYHNNSPEALTFIYIHLWPNAYKDNTTALVKQQLGNNNWKLYQAPEEERGFIDLLDFHIDNQKATWALDEENIDIAKLTLNEPLLPGESITISTPFRVKIPSAKFSRLGHVEDSYQITQWYPKPAVYDLDGWHQMPYLNQGEFYSEFGTFEVKITLPENYVVGATGDLQEQSEIDFLNKKAKETKTWLDANPELGSPNQPSNDFPESATKTKTLTYIQKDVHDFAWFADKRFKVLKGEVELPHSKRKVTTWNMFTPKYADTWRNSLEYIHDATYYYSLWNGDYLYNHVTAVDGTIAAGGGMEYPNITVIGSSTNKFQLETVIMHEVGHNWFYGMLGSNERMHTWMDEGLNSFNEQRYMDTKYPDKNILKSMMGLPIKTKKLNYAALDQLMYEFSAKMYSDQPMETHADEFSSMNYGMIAYKKSAVVFKYLKSYLGNDVFDECMLTYFDEWKIRHPQPEDLKEVFTRITKKDLSWFFDDMIKTTRIVDYKITNIKSAEEGYFDVEISNKGEIKAPCSISVMRDNKVISTTWAEPIHVGTKKKIQVKAEKGDLIRIDGLHQMPDMNKHNNTTRTKGIFKKIEPIRLKMGIGLDSDEYSNLFWIPLVGWNEHNKFMFGLHFHNTPLPSRSFEYSFTPMYSFATKNLNGFGRISYNKRNYELGVKGRKFNLPNPTVSKKIQVNYTKVNPYFILKNIGGQGNTLLFSSSYILNIHRSKVEGKNLLEYNERMINKIKYRYRKKNLFSKFNMTVSAEQFLDLFTKQYDVYPLSVEANYSHNYGMKKKEVKFRGFAGKMFRANDQSVISWNSGGNKNTDFGYDHLYLGRNENEGILSKQISNYQGGLRMWFGDYSNNVMVSGLVAFELPVKLPLEIFAGTSWATLYTGPEDNYIFPHNDFNYNIGITLDAKIARIHVPLLYSQPSRGSKINIWEAISFEFNIEDLSPSKILKNNIR